MDDTNTAEVEAKVDAAFGVGFGDTSPAKVVEEPKPEPAKTIPAAAPPERPRYVRLTEQEWNNTKAAAGKVSTLESQVARLTGSIPKAEQIIQQVIAKVQSQTPAGSPVELTDDDFAEWEETFPEVGATMRKSLDKIVKRMNVRGTAAPAPIDEGVISKAVETVLIGREKQTLNRAHPTWREIVGAVDMRAGEKPPEGNTFRQWLAKQPIEYQNEINETDYPAVVQSAIERFLASSKPSTPAAPDRDAVRRAKIADAVTPRAEGNPPPPKASLSAEEAFATGFKTGRPH